VGSPLASHETYFQPSALAPALAPTSIRRATSEALVICRKPTVFFGSGAGALAPLAEPAATAPAASPPTAARPRNRVPIAVRPITLLPSLVVCSSLRAPCECPHAARSCGAE